MTNVELRIKFLKESVASLRVSKAELMALHLKVQKQPKWVYWVFWFRSKYEILNELQSRITITQDAIDDTNRRILFLMKAQESTQTTDGQWKMYQPR